MTLLPGTPIIIRLPGQPYDGLRTEVVGVKDRGAVVIDAPYIGSAGREIARVCGVLEVGEFEVVTVPPPR